MFGVFSLYFARKSNTCACVRACDVGRKNNKLQITQRPRATASAVEKQLPLGLVAKFRYVSILQRAFFCQRHDARKRKQGIQSSTFQVPCASFLSDTRPQSAQHRPPRGTYEHYRQEPSRPSSSS
ncbi:unnamed protein product, partial [Pylaiella littoralis]